MKLWDITPRKRHRPKITPSEKKEKKRTRTWFFFIILIGAFFIAFFGAGKISPSQKSQGPNPTSAANTPTSTATLKTQGNISIKLLNGTGRFEETDKIKTLLTNSGFTVSTTENALNLYNETIIYYQPLYESFAQNIKQAIKEYNPQITQFTSETKYDIVIVIGNK